MHTISTVGYLADNWLAVSLRVWIISFLTLSGPHVKHLYNSSDLNFTKTSDKDVKCMLLGTNAKALCIVAFFIHKILLAWEHLRPKFTETTKKITRKTFMTFIFYV